MEKSKRSPRQRPATGTRQHRSSPESKNAACGVTESDFPVQRTPLQQQDTAPGAGRSAPTASSGPALSREPALEPAELGRRDWCFRQASCAGRCVRGRKGSVLSSSQLHTVLLPMQPTVSKREAAALSKLGVCVLE